MSTLLRRYTDADAGGPGVLTGAVGSLLTLLRACLVNGYGAFPAAGWTEPIAAAGNIGAFRPNAGNRFHLLINDNGPNGTASYREAWATGWETLAGIGSPVGSGTGQFPTAAQLLTTGHVVVRKSASADGVGRSWRLYADNRTMYLFIAPGDSAGVYTTLMFGDFYSISTVADPYATLLVGRTTENSNSSSIDAFGTQSAGPTSALANGAYVARVWGGAGGSVIPAIQGDYGKNGGNNTFYGVMQYPNGTDNSLYLSPIYIFDAAAGMARGRYRGVFQICHAIASFADGQTFNGAGDYAGKTFEVIRSVATQNGALKSMFAIETSSTVEAN